MDVRSRWVTALSLVSVAHGLLTFVVGWALMLGGGLGSAAGAGNGGTVMILGSLLFALGLVSLVVGYGFWAMKRWAWSAAFVVYTGSLVVNLATVVLAGATPVGVVVQMAVAVGVMVYLVQPRARAAFGR